MKRFQLFLAAILITLSFQALAQSPEPVVSGKFEHLSLGKFIDELSKPLGYKFYFDAAQRDSLDISIEVRSVTLDSALSMAFRNTPYYFAIDHSGRHVFITYNRPITTALSEAWTGKHDQQNVLKESGVLAVQRDPARELRPTIGATAENKIYQLGNAKAPSRTGNITITGYVRFARTGEPVIGAALSLDAGKGGTTTNQYGYYTLSVPQGKYVLGISGIDVRSTKRQLVVHSEAQFNIEVSDQIQTLKDVIITSDKALRTRRTQLGVEKIDIKTIKQVPMVFGEPDVLRVVLTLPGVKSVGEASTGFNVRGGATDQNLILYNDATIYNPSHFFGFFSAFNAEGVKDVELFKSSIPAYYGGRLASVLAITTREGNKKKFTGSAGIGLLTSRINVEGPLINDRTSFMLGARTTYSNWILKALPGKAEYKNSNAAFSDVDLHISHEINAKNNLFLTGYYSRDKSNLASDTTFSYSNQNLSLKWKHVFNNKLFGVFTAGYDGYRYNNYSEVMDEDAYSLKFDINQLSAKMDFNYYVNSKHTLNAGISSIRYRLNPATFSPRGSNSLIVAQQVEKEQGQESAIYINDNYDVTPALTLNAGIRYSLYQSLGPKNVNRYAAGVPLDESTLIESVPYKSGKTIKTYHGPEFRISGRYAFAGDFSIKAGYNTMRQYIHMLSNTSAIAPTDIWKLSDLNIKPQYGDQASIGFYKNFKSNTIETSVEVYYKRMKDYLDYKSGASLVLNPHVETDVIGTRGKAYGAEFMIRKTAGKVNGWVSYTYSRIFLRTDDPTGGELINGGKFYPGNYDKPHDVTMVGNFRFSHRYSLSMNTTYSTGRPITLPIGKYYYGGAPRLFYSNRNEYRIPDYFRVDLGFNIGGNHKVHQLAHNSFTVGVYNVLGRKNAYSTYFTTENGKINGYKLSIFGSPIPYINYNIHF